VYPDDAERVLKFMQGGTNNWPSEYLQTEHRMVRRDGAVRKVVVRVGLLKDPQGCVIKVVGVNQDVTDR
jgi:PAS domain-containing protein